MASETVHVANIPFDVKAEELAHFFESVVGTVCICELKAKNYKWRHDGYGFVQFQERHMCECAISMADCHTLILKNSPLKVKYARRDIKLKPKYVPTRLDAGYLYVGCLFSAARLGVLWPSSNAKQSVSAEFDFDCGLLRLFITLEGPATLPARAKREYKMEFPFRDLSKVDPVLTGPHNKALLIQPWSPPRIYKRQLDHDDMGLHFFNLLAIGGGGSNGYSYHRDEPQQPWVRTVDFTTNCSIGQSFAYCVELPAASTASYNTILHRLERFHLCSSSGPSGALALEPALAFADPNSVIVPILTSPHVTELPFGIQFLLHHLLHTGTASGPCLTPAFYAMLYPEGCQLPPITRSYASLQMPIEIVEKALLKLCRQIEVCYDPLKYMKEQFEVYKSGNEHENGNGFPLRSNVIELDDGQMRVRRLMVTPTKGIFMGPEIDVSNRVTRQYKDCIDSFLRVSFVEEDWDYLPSASLSVPLQGGAASGLRPDRSDVYRRISRFLKEGFSFGGKKYEFLAFSSSQLREQSVWMFSGSQHGLTTQHIREWMGDFLSIRNVAECAARMGQCFSSSTPTLKVENHEVEHLEDIEKRVGIVRYCFSDGIGKISESFAREVAAKCGSKVSGKVPSAYQIRYGGYKGVVAVDPWSRWKLSLRNSMKKFPSQHIDLEVLNYTRVIPCFLNRQIITLLSTLGVEASVFQQMQHNVVQQLENMLHDVTVALEILEVSCSGNNHFANMEMLRAGFSPRNEPHLNGLLRAFRAHQLMNLRTKSRILVPKGRCLMGCLDESATLQYGEVFVQVSPTPGNRFFLDDGLGGFPSYRGVYHDQNPAHVVQGCRVVVAKNPCVHPGDVRILKAVDCPQLHHMVDCIVFPQLGPRPHPNECSGSDLDGDLYFVSWDSKLVANSMDLPMDYTPAPKTLLDHSVTVEEIQQFFLDHMLNDSLGIIANAHVVHADRSPMQARDPKCLELAKLLSIAVDFPKTGRPAVMPVNLRPDEYPDFMEKGNKEETYVSSGILGKLYRAVRDASIEQLPIPVLSKSDIAAAFDRDLIAEGFQEYVQEAAFLKSEYDARLVALMNQYGIETEAELVSGNILNLSRYYKRRTGDVKQRIMFAMASLRRHVKGWFHHGYYGYEDVEDESHPQGMSHAIVGYTPQDDIYAKASAWYFVTYHPDYVNDCEVTPFLSFPWILYDKLIALKTQARNNDPCTQM